MEYQRYGSPRHAQTRQNGWPKKRWLKLLVVVVLLAAVGFAAYKIFAPSPVERAVNQLQFDGSVTEAEKQTIRSAIQNQEKTYDGQVTASIRTSLKSAKNPLVTNAYVPVSNKYAVRQEVTKTELNQLEIYVPQNMNSVEREAIAELLGLQPEQLKPLDSPVEEIADAAVAFVPLNELSPDVKLLELEGQYYLDSFTSGAIFRRAVFSGDGMSGLSGLELNNYESKDATLKVNMTGVTALTREMMNKLQTVGDATYFSQKIGTFLADADITHVSNEVSFKEGCTYSASVFCSPPEMIEALKASGVDLVEITGNHNNDVGRQYNTDTIELYHELGWGTFGGGLNAAEAAKPYVANQKGSKIAFLGYNYADSPGSGAIATNDGAGANGYTADKAKSDIASAKNQADFVIVDVQFWECYAYPDGYIEYPECDVPIGRQAEVFRQIADFGADMVVGSSAHQPQTYEFYNGTPIYYGLGNLYFDQTRWPGTERGIVLTHYLAGGKLLQTKLSPTVYHDELQTQLMNNEDTLYLLERLKTARGTAGL